MGAALLRVSKLQEKWQAKLEGTTTKGANVGRRAVRWVEKYAFFLLVLITVLREGLEAVIFIGGVGLAMPASAFPLAVITGLGVGALFGYLIYRYV